VTYLVDANVLSEATKPRPNPTVIGWLRKNESAIVIDAIIFGEISFGIQLLPAGKRRKRLERWFDEGIGRIECLAWTSETAVVWAKLVADLRKAGKAMPIKDSLIAATALQHGLTVVTRNTGDFAKTKANVVNPFG
jgi:predicted nucleic acid-binding protein